jgi:hypothetical protein
LARPRAGDVDAVGGAVGETSVAVNPIGGTIAVVEVEPIREKQDAPPGTRIGPGLLGRLGEVKHTNGRPPKNLVSVAIRTDTTGPTTDTHRPGA